MHKVFINFSQAGHIDSFAGSLLQECEGFNIATESAEDFGNKYIFQYCCFGIKKKEIAF